MSPRRSTDGTHVALPTQLTLMALWKKKSVGLARPLTLVIFRVYISAPPLQKSFLRPCVIQLSELVAFLSRFSGRGVRGGDWGINLYKFYVTVNRNSNATECFRLIAFMINLLDFQLKHCIINDKTNIILTKVNEILSLFRQCTHQFST